MSEQTFVYVTYIASTAEKVWNALIDGELTRQYWQHENVNTDNWAVGSPWKHVGLNDRETPKLVGEVLECVPQQRLVLSWIAPHRVDDKSKHTKVALEIETVADMVRLTVTHTDLYEDMYKGISKGWPRVLSSLKSFLETGRPLDVFA